MCQHDSQTDRIMCREPAARKQQDIAIMVPSTVALMVKAPTKSVGQTAMPKQNVVETPMCRGRNARSTFAAPNTGAILKPIPVTELT